MARIFTSLLVILLSLMVLAGCESGWHAPARTVDMESPPTIEQARQQLAETNSVRVDSLEMTSQLAGYPVAMPASMPQDIDMVNFLVFKLGVPGAAPSTAEFPYSVEQIFTLDPDPPFVDPLVMLTQSRNHIEGVGGDSVDVDIDGNPGKKTIVPRGGDSPGRLGLSWSDGTLYYVMEGTLADPLDEAAILRIAASVSVP
jgi:hypothetical protein